MPISVRNNGNYGGNLINQKYSPLDINNLPAPVNAEQNIYQALYNSRINTLNNAGLFPANLNLYANSWGNITAQESVVGVLPPVVVVSSNRATWIDDKVDQGLNLLPPAGHFADVNDTAALVAGSVPWYMPARINQANRNVYIVVHRYEYELYHMLLSPRGFTIIGWQFDEGPESFISQSGSILRQTFAGFGASRYAAIEFCKYVFNTLTARPAADQKAWIVDDNVVYVRGFPGFNQTEAVMDNTIWGLGFSGATVNSTEQEVTQLVQPANLANLANLQQVGVLQQCVLWNIGQLYAGHLNFSPYFVTSNEDTSLSNYLRLGANNTLRIATGASVFKGNPTNDGGEDVSSLRENILELLFATEQNVSVQPVANQGGQQTLRSYVLNYILPNAQPNIRFEPPQLTTSKAVEQIMNRTIVTNNAWLPARMFLPNGANNQVVVQH